MGAVCLPTCSSTDALVYPASFKAGAGVYSHCNLCPLSPCRLFTQWRRYLTPPRLLWETAGSQSSLSPHREAGLSERRRRRKRRRRSGNCGREGERERDPGRDSSHWHIWIHNKGMLTDRHVLIMFMSDCVAWIESLLQVLTAGSIKLIFTWERAKVCVCVSLSCPVFFTSTGEALSH